jgi:hypothetical protein
VRAAAAAAGADVAQVVVEADAKGVEYCFAVVGSRWGRW